MFKKNKMIFLCSCITLSIALILFVMLLFKSNKKDIIYKIIFDSNGGSEIETQNIKKGELVQKPQDPIKDGYIFIEWQYEDALFDFNTKIEKDITLVAKWLEVSEEIELVTIKFETNGGTTISNQIIEKGSKVVMPANPTREGYKFIGWYYNNEKFDFNGEINENMTITAKWEKTGVTGNSSNHNPSTGGNSSNSSNNNSGTIVPSTPTVKKYTVKFDSNGGSPVTEQTIVEGSKATQPLNPTRIGYTFVGWTLNGKTYDFTTTVTNNITLIAQWTQKTYSVVANKVDNISPARVLTIYEDGNVITVEGIQYSDGSSLCSGQNPNVNYYAIEGETSVRLILSGGTVVIASLTVN